MASSPPTRSEITPELRIAPPSRARTEVRRFPQKAQRIAVTRTGAPCTGFQRLSRTRFAAGMDRERAGVSAGTARCVDSEPDYWASEFPLGQSLTGRSIVTDGAVGARKWSVFVTVERAIDASRR